MTNEPRDEWSELRRMDAAKAPPFDAMWQPRAGAGAARSAISPWWVALPAASVTLAAAAALVLWIGRTPASEPAPTAAAATPAAVAAVGGAAAPATLHVVVALERGPLDFLLDEPVLASAPDFDSDPAKAGAP